MSDNLAVKKIHKAIDSLQKALHNIEDGNVRIAIGDLDYVRENAQEAIYLLIAELEEKTVDKSKSL